MKSSTMSSTMEHTGNKSKPMHCQPMRVPIQPERACLAWMAPLSATSNARSSKGRPRSPSRRAERLRGAI